MLLKKFGVPTPDATVAFSKDAALDALDTQGFPKVIKANSWKLGKINFKT